MGSEFFVQTRGERVEGLTQLFVNRHGHIDPSAGSGRRGRRLGMILIIPRQTQLVQ
jgi:hypothetical protein